MLSRADYIDSKVHMALKASAKGKLLYNASDEIDLLIDRFQSFHTTNYRTRIDKGSLESYGRLMSDDNDLRVHNHKQNLKTSHHRESLKATFEVRRLRNANFVSNEYEKQGREFQADKQKAFADFNACQSRKLQEKFESAETESAASLLKRVQNHKSTKAIAREVNSQPQIPTNLERRSGETEKLDQIKPKEMLAAKEKCNSELHEDLEVKKQEKDALDRQKLEAETQQRLKAEEAERQGHREKEQAAIREQEKKKTETNAGLLRLKTMLDIVQKDMKLNEGVLAQISAQSEQFKSQVNEDDFFQLQLQIAKQALSNMCEVVKFSQQHIQEIKDEIVEIVKKYSKEVNEALRDVQSLIDLAEKELKSQLQQHQERLNKDAIDSVADASETGISVNHKSGHKPKAQESENDIHSTIESTADEKPQTNPMKVSNAPQSTVVISKPKMQGTKIFQFYASESKELYKKYEQMVSSTNSLTKLFLKNVKGAANSMRNSLSANSKENLLYQRKRIVSLFQGQTIIVSDVTVDPTRVEHGTEVVRIIVAESLISNLQQFHKRDLALASLLVELAFVDELFQTVLIAAFHRKCPFTRPEYLVKKVDQTEDDFMLEMGYVKQLGDWEDSKSYLNRMLSTVQLYSAVLTCRPISQFELSAKHPYGYAMAWSWLSEFINMEPFSGFSAGILRAFLAICGRDMLYQYGKQFRKMMRVVHGSYLEKCRKIGDDLAYVGSLENSLQSFFSSGKFFQDCQLDEDFWN